ncbi:MAG: hypothetical protein QME21_17410 [Anaerolineales bacterium]|nr:hypothetical protein [Anaerolineales bacterium]
MKIEDVITLVAKGIPLTELVRKIPWKTFPTNKWDELRIIALNLEDTSISQNLLSFLIQISQNQNIPFSLKVSFDAYQHPALTDNDRSKVLIIIKRLLEKFRQNLVESKSLNTIKDYFAYQANYHYLSGQFAERRGGKSLTYKEYIIAIDFYMKAGDVDKAKQLEDYLESFQQQVEVQASEMQQRIPQLEKLVDEKTRELEQLSQDLQYYQAELRAAREQEDKNRYLQKDNSEAQIRLKQLQQELNEALKKQKQLQSENNDALTSLEHLQQEHNQALKNLTQLQLQYDEVLTKLKQLKQEYDEDQIKLKRLLQERDEALIRLKQLQHEQDHYKQLQSGNPSPYLPSFVQDSLKSSK